MLPALRSLDLMPSPVPDRPGLLMRDPLRFSDATLIVPPPLVPCLALFDGAHSELDLRECLVRITGDLEVGGLLHHLIEALSQAGFLQDERFEQCKKQAEQSFAEAPLRAASHAGSAYPANAADLQNTLAGYLDGAALKACQADQPPVTAIAAPHVSPFGGVEAYRAAYSALSPADADRTFVILGVSHYGQPGRIGLTNKSFSTPFGEARTDTAIVQRLASQAGDGALREDYCHAVEHSIEFQVVFLQHLFGPEIRMVPILCGSFHHSLERGQAPEADDRVRRALDALGELAAREGSRLLWVLGVDMAHMGRRYGDSRSARAGQDEMLSVELRDRDRIGRIEQGDAGGFWERVAEHRQDDLKWCGSAPIYAFLRAVPGARGQLLHYQQWNIDDSSVVSFAGIRFHSA
ncbi:MAG TPA: AmmeMemoRadiSam system protein B [Bryobacteraceae bacterium]|nr:AmmeMemoRadiSam system protein B [Bryobacteraceae bacterium]